MTYPEISDFAEGQTQKLQCFSTWQFFSALPAQILKPCNVRCAHSSAFGYGWRPTPMSLRVAEDPMREFPNFSWSGTHRSVLPCKSPCGSSGRMVFFLGFSWSGKCDSNGGKPQRTEVLWLSHGTFRDLLRKPGQVSKRKRVGALKVRYPSELVSCGRSHAQRINAQEVRWRGMMVEFWAKNLRKPTVYG